MADTEELARKKFDAWWADDVSTEALKTGDAQLFALATWQAAYASGKRDGAPKWIRVEDRLPEFSGTYLVTVHGSGDDAENYTVTIPCDWSPEAKRWHDLRG
jgi:hypothetical protein